MPPAQQAADGRTRLRAVHDPLQCERCGRCCTIKLSIAGETVTTPFTCPHFDEQTHLCRIYPERHELNPHCMTIPGCIELGILPSDCPYVDGRSDYRPPRRATPEEIAAYADACRAAQAEILREAERRRAARRTRARRRFTVPCLGAQPATSCAALSR